MSQYLGSAAVVSGLRAELESVNCARPGDMLIEKDWIARRVLSYRDVALMLDDWL